jgi:hypothetical protein
MADRRGQLAQVKIDKTGPWSMIGTMINGQRRTPAGV